MGTLYDWGNDAFVAATNAGISPVIAALPLGRYLVAWEGADGSGSGIWGEIFDPDGSILKAPFLLNETTTGDQWSLSAIGTQDGYAAVAYKTAQGSRSTLDHVLVREFDGFGNPVTDASGNTEIDVGVLGYGPTVAPSPTVGFVVSGWYDLGTTPADDSFQYRRFGTNLQHQDFGGYGPASYHQQYFSDTLLQSSSYVDAHATYVDGSWDVAVDILNADGSLHTSFIANQVTSGDQVAPHASALSDGRFVVTWQDNSGVGGDASGYGIKARAFNADGSPASDEVLVNTGTSGDQTQPHVAGLTAGGAAELVWTSTAAGSPAVEAHAINQFDASRSGTPEGNDLSGSNVNDWINGADGHDSLVGHGGHDFLEGGDGNDALDGGAGDDILNGNNGHDTLFGQDGNDLLLGGDGDDVLVGGPGQDAMVGDFGNDTYYVDGPGDLVLEGWGLVSDAPGETRVDGTYRGSDTVFASGDYLLPNGVEIGALIGSARNLWGNDAANNLYGNELDNTIHGGGGVDTIVGGDGNDTLAGDAGNDSVWGANGNDMLLGGDGDDRLDGQDGDDTLWGGNGNDTLVGSVGNNALWGEEGNDNLWGEGGDDLLVGGNGDDILHAGGGGDVLWGGAGDDWLAGGEGPGGSVYVLHGEAGSDNFWFQGPAYGVGIVADFTPGEDHIALSAGPLAPPSSFQLGGMTSVEEGVNLFYNAYPNTPTSQPMLIENTGTGELFYDPDGTGPDAAQEFAIVYGAPLLASDFMIV